MNIFEAPPVPVSPSLSEYNNAVNASRFVKGFSIAVLVYSVLLFLGINLLSSAIVLGTGLFIFRYDEEKFYRVRCWVPWSWCPHSWRRCHFSVRACWR